MGVRVATRTDSLRVRCVLLQFTIQRQNSPGSRVPGAADLLRPPRSFSDSSRPDNFLIECTGRR